ncbi:hypothetical protein COO60DRAFT_616267 [Scenedesmus sp. NREL 46B-D3]|nr:hypothetical protein COO60DRAFT_616267 [Scenedesmus sp. NREL 46B-D3]
MPCKGDNTFTRAEPGTVVQYTIIKLEWHGQPSQQSACRHHIDASSNHSMIALHPGLCRTGRCIQQKVRVPAADKARHAVVHAINTLGLALPSAALLYWFVRTQFDALQHHGCGVRCESHVWEMAPALLLPLYVWPFACNTQACLLQGLHTELAGIVTSSLKALAAAWMAICTCLVSERQCCCCC